jgi:CheY-like chemotaxis protein
MAERKTRILFVDDQMNSMMSPFRTNPWEYEFAHCAKPSEAIKLIREKEFDVIVTDIMFPRTRSEQVEEFLTECASKKIPTIVYTDSHFYAAQPKLEGIEIVYKYHRESPEEFVERVNKAAGQHTKEAAWQKKPAAKGKNVRVLVVDDKKRFAEGVVEYMNRYQEGFEAHHCGNPKEADEILKKSKFDVLVCDIDFDNFSPEQVERFLKRHLEQGMKAVVITGGGWDVMPRMAGLPIIDRDSKAIAAETRKVFEQGGKVKLDQRELRRLVNPDWHPMSPLQRNMTPKEAELIVLRQKLDAAAHHGNYPKRDLDEMMRDYMRLERELRAPQKPGGKNAGNRGQGAHGKKPGQLPRRPR